MGGWVCSGGNVKVKVRRWRRANGGWVCRGRSVKVSDGKSTGRPTSVHQREDSGAGGVEAAVRQCL